MPDTAEPTYHLPDVTIEVLARPNSHANLRLKPEERGYFREWLNGRGRGDLVGCQTNPFYVPVSRDRIVFCVSTRPVEGAAKAHYGESIGVCRRKLVKAIAKATGDRFATSKAVEAAGGVRNIPLWWWIEFP